MARQGGQLTRQELAPNSADTQDVISMGHGADTATSQPTQSRRTSTRVNFAEAATDTDSEASSASEHHVDDASDMDSAKIMADLAAAQEVAAKAQRAKYLCRRNTRRMGLRMSLSWLHPKRTAGRTVEALLDAGIVSHYLARDFMARSPDKPRLSAAQMYQQQCKDKAGTSRLTSDLDVECDKDKADSSDSDRSTSSDDQNAMGHSNPDKASAIAARNRLMFFIQDEVLKSWRSLDHAPAGHQFTGRFKAKVMEICSSRRQSKLLNVEVDVVTLRYKLQKQPKTDTRSKKEKDVERQDRNTAFWRLYHLDDGKMHPAVARDSQQAKRSGKPTLSPTSSRNKKDKDMRVAASMVATTSKFWVPAQNTELPDAKLVRGRQRGKAETKVGKPNTVSRNTDPDSPDIDDDAGSPLVGMSTTRRLVNHRNVVHQRRLQSNEASGQATLRISQSLPAMGMRPERERERGHDRGHENVRGTLGRSGKKWVAPAPSRTMTLSGTASSWVSVASDYAEESMMGTKSGYWDFGKFLDPRTKRKRARRHDFRSRFGPVKEEEPDMPSLPALTHAGQTGIRAAHLAEAEDAMRRSASETKFNSSRSKLPSLASTRGKFTSTSSPSLRGPWMPPEKLAPVVSLPKAFDRSPVHATNRNAGASSTQLEADADLATMRYIRVCKAASVVPTPSVLTMAQTHKISGDGEGLVDDDLCAFATMVRSLDHVESVDLTGNALLSDRALVTFLRKLFGRPASSSLTWLSLEGCKGAARGAIDTTVALLSEPQGLFNLVHVNLSGIAIAATSQLAMCKAVAEHHQLRSVHLADIGLGLHPAAKLCVTSLLVAERLEELDLGWNCFASDVFEALGQHVAEHKSLTKLHLASCAAVTATGHSGESPVTWFLECLSRDRTLTALDVSLNRIDYRGALVLEDALEYHKGLTELRLGQNPLGVGGMRSFLRLLSRDSSGLKHFECAQCDGRGAANEGATGERAFNATDPSGRYTLSLSNPYHRTVLRMLYKACERFDLSPEKAFFDLEYHPQGPSASGKDSKHSDKHGGYKHPREKDKYGVWCVPGCGALTLNFSIVEVLSTVFSIENLGKAARQPDQPKSRSVGGCGQAGLAAPSNANLRISWLHRDAVVRDNTLQPVAARFTERYMASVRFMPSFRKVVPLLAQWQSLKGQPREQQLLLDALSHDFLLTFAHIHQFCRVRSRTVDVLSKLLPCMEGGPVQLYLAMTIPGKLDDFLKVYNNCQRLFHFNPENPTARYRLDLGNTADYAVGESLVLIDRWEAVMARKKGCVDMSQRGNWSNFRNIMYQNHEIASVADFQLPSHDTIEFDFVSWRRPPPHARVLQDECWEQVMLMLTMSECKPDAKVKALSSISDQLFLKALQLRELLSAFEEAENHVEVMCLFLLRLGDPQNTKVVRARLNEAERKMITHRMGILTVYPFVQPEQYKFDSKLSIYEDRMAVALTFSFAVREGMHNIQELSLILPDGKHYPFLQGAPPSWEKYEVVPTEGVFHCKYKCSPEDRRLAIRKEFAFKYAGWDSSGVDANTMWWSDLNEAPDPVLYFLYYCMKQFKDMDTPFRTICGSGPMTLDMFKRQMASWGWDKFKKNPTWVTQVFRYLDPDSGGEVTREEWGAVEQLFKELQLTILEFLQHLNRTFMGNFGMAWDEIDADGSDSIDFEEWEEATKYICFFGAAVPIFYFLADDNDMIGRKAWSRLPELWADRHDLRQKIRGG